MNHCAGNPSSFTVAATRADCDGALDAKRPGPVATRDIERVLERGGDAPVYGPNLRASCRRMEAAGLLHTLRAPNLQLAVELTDAGNALDALLAHAGFSAAQAQVLRWHCIRWPLTGDEEFEQRYGKF